MQEDGDVEVADNADGLVARAVVVKTPDGVAVYIRGVGGRECLPLVYRLAVHRVGRRYRRHLFKEIKEVVRLGVAAIVGLPVRLERFAIVAKPAQGPSTR